MVQVLRIALVLLAMASAGCVTGAWTKWRSHIEPPDGDALTVGESELSDCLALLGAPLYVRENGEGAYLAWGWADEGRWGVTARVPLGKASASFRYEQSQLGLQGLVLFFDGGWVLKQIRKGRLADILPPAQQRAQLVEGDPGEE